MPNINEWMNGKTILITGGSGFLGKVLIEKLLRSCSGIKKIYLILRPKGAIDPEERWNNIAKDDLYKKLLTEKPDIIKKKVVVLNGDMSLSNFGLSEEILEELRTTVNIIFHSAATIRFDDLIQKALLTNTKAALEMCKLASKMDNLDCFNYVSTTFCNLDRGQIFYEEKIHEPCQDWRILLKLVETENASILNTISSKIVQNHPNTYTLTKSLSEKIVEEYSTKFPTVIARPSVVIGIFADPLPGWTDNMNGIIGVCVANCKGVLRVLKGNKDCALDCVAVDWVVKSLIVCAWDKATRLDKELSVYNYAYKDFISFTYGDLNKLSKDVNIKYTLDNDLWYPFMLFTTNNFYYHFLFYLLQLLPAVFVDSILLLLKKKPKLIKLNIKIYKLIQALRRFAGEEIWFENKEFRKVRTRMVKEDMEEFDMMPPTDIDPTNIMEIMQRGVKIYYFKEKLEDLAYHRLKYQRLFYLDRFVRGVLVFGFSYLFYKIIWSYT